jgi:hypothetical protein
MPEMSLRLSVPADGLRAGNIELREAGNLPAFGRDELLASLQELPVLAEGGRLLALAAVGAETGEVVGGGTLHHLDSERRIVEVGYFVLPHARRRAWLRRSHGFSPSMRSRSASSGWPLT